MTPGSQAQTMQCMEIWGGNVAAARDVRLSGIDVHVFSRPLADDRPEGEPGGGDIHYLSSCATGRISRMFIADVSGHGGEVAAIASNLRRLMGKFSNYIDQRRFMESVNERFNELREAGERYSGLFATAVVATYFSPTDEVTLTTAGHPRPLLFDASTGSWATIAGDADRAVSDRPANLPLGVLESVAFDQHRVRLGEGDAMLLYTDALIEIADPSGRQLGEGGLVRLLNRIGLPAEPGQLVARLQAELADYAAGGSESASREDAATFTDDATVLIVRRNASKPKPSVGLAAAAGWRLVRNAAGSLLRRKGSSGPVLTIPEARARLILGAMCDRFNR